MTRYSDYDDDYPEGIEADPFLPIDPSFTPAEIAGLLCGAAVLGAFFYYIVLPHLHSAAIVMLLLASSR